MTMKRSSSFFSLGTTPARTREDFPEPDPPLTSFEDQSLGDPSFEEQQSFEEPSGGIFEEPSEKQSDEEPERDPEKEAI